MNDIFRRVEQKYIINELQKEELLKRLNSNIEKDDYPRSKICNIYFDNQNNDLIINSLEKPIFKQKIRLRSYNSPTLDDSVYLEIKNKYKGIVNKRRIKLTLKEFNDYKEKSLIKNTQIMKELDYLFKLYNLKEYMYISYDRESYREKNNKNLRITFDSNLIARQNNLKLEQGSFGEKYLKEGKYIMEIKVLDAIPLWLVKELSELKIYPTSYSKIGTIYTNKGSEILC